VLIDEIAGPTGDAVDLAVLRKHCGEVDEEWDPALRLWMGSARHLAEAETSRQLLPATLELVLDGFPGYQGFKVPRPPLLEVLSVKYLDVDGVEQTLAEDQYVVDVFAGERAPPGRLRLAYNASWPLTQGVPRSVRVRFRAGYAVTEDDEEVPRLPDGIQHAICVGVAESFKNREETIQGTISSAAAMTMRRLLAPYKVWDFEW